MPYYAVANLLSITKTNIINKMFCGCGILITNTRKNDLMRHVTPREAVFGPVIHSIFDTWHYEVLWTCNLTRLLWYACNYMRLILYIMLHSTHLKPNCQMHIIACSQVRSEVHSWLHSVVHSQPAWHTFPSTPLSTFSSTLPGMLTRTLPIALDGTLPACLSIRSRVSAQDTPKYTSEYAPKYTTE